MSLSTPPRAAAMLVAACALGLALAADASTATPSGKRQTTLRVGSAAGFDAAVRALRRSGGTTVLRPRLYRELVIGWRTGKRLRVVGMRGARVGRVVFDRSRHVSLGRVTIGPVRGDALLDVRDSRHIALHDLVVTARGTRFSASIRIPDSRHVTIRRSNFSHCGDRSPSFTFCVRLWRWSRNILIEDNWFHDCRGCDFVHGRFGSDLTIRRNRFERALPCRMDAHRCGHQDLVQLFAGRRLLVERNHFGVTARAGRSST